MRPADDGVPPGPGAGAPVATTGPGAGQGPPPFRSLSPFRSDVVAATLRVLGTVSTETAMAASISGRDYRNGSTELGYGETDLRALLGLLGAIRGLIPRPSAAGRTFLDLGCGRGHCVLVAACSGVFRRCQGIECVAPLYALALQHQRQWAEEVSLSLSLSLSTDRILNI